MDEQLQDYEIIVAEKHVAYLVVILETCGGDKCFRSTIEDSDRYGYIINTTKSNTEKLKERGWVVSINPYATYLVSPVIH